MFDYYILAYRGLLWQETVGNDPALLRGASRMSKMKGESRRGKQKCWRQKLCIRIVQLCIVLYWRGIGLGEVAGRGRRKSIDREGEMPLRSATTLISIPMYAPSNPYVV